jgi:hypothetical protein
MKKNDRWIFSEGFFNKQQIKKELSSYSHEQLVAHIVELRTEMKMLQNAITESKPNEVTNTNEEFQSKLANYKQEWTYARKISFLLILHNKPLSSLEIQTFFLKYDKGFKSNQRPQTTLAGILTRICKTGRIGRYKLKGQKELLFIMPTWIDKTGELKEVYFNQIPLY